ncbi:HNH endonuclease signature motif containing protein [Geodermatophilus telluris]|uniref:HNH endonuclease signature motif containing protein n=1 Tax=Geodermatophilus telluris TaxID=1190417 RepID=UPI002693634A
MLDRPAAVDTYEHSAAQDVFVHTRDRTCRFPGCGQRVGWADADHVIPHAHGGPTDCANLCCLCRSHHRLQTSAPDWRFEMSADGVLTVTTPSGTTRTTRPPGVRPPPPPESLPSLDGGPPSDRAEDAPPY